MLWSIPSCRTQQAWRGRGLAPHRHMRVARAHTRTKMYVLLAPLRAMIECVLTKKYVLLAPLPAMLECVRARRWFGMRWTLSWSTSLRCVRMCVCARMVVRVRVDVHGRTGQ